MNEYIGVAGVNGYGVYTNVKQLLRTKPFIKEYNVRTFKDVQRAIKWVENKYIKLQKDEEHQYTIGKIERLNWFYYRCY